MTNSNHIKLLLNLARHCRERQSQSKGFTLPELLMAMVVAGIVVYAMLSLVINLLGTDKTETAKSQTQAEMSQAMDYIARDLQQAVYIYPGDCLGETDKDTGEEGEGDPYNCSALSKQIDFEAAGVTPVLAFWKLEEVADYMKDDDKLPTCNQGDANAQECFSLLTSLHTYTLVVYSYQEVGDDDEIWNGPNIIRRFQLRKYTNVQNLTKPTKDYSDPSKPDEEGKTDFGQWQSKSKIPVDNNPVLVDFVDQDDADFKEDCPADYTESENSISSFYACVSNPSSAGQDAIVYLRGNAAERAGKPNSRNQVYLPSIKRQVKARSVLNYTPPEL